MASLAVFFVLIAEDEITNALDGNDQLYLTLEDTYILYYYDTNTMLIQC